jgi:hypothetical protein
MLLLVGVLFNTEKYKAMKQRSSFHISDHASCHSQEEWRLDSSMLRSMSRNMSTDYMSAKGSMSFMLKRQDFDATVSFLLISYSWLDMVSYFITRFLSLDHLLIMMMYLFWIRSPEFSSSMVPTHPFKSEQKLLKLCNTSKTHFMMASATLDLLVSKSIQGLL